MYRIAVDVERRRLNVVVAGLWNKAEAVAYRLDVVAAAEPLARFDGGFDMLVEMATEGVLPADATIEIEQSLTDLVNMGLKKAAHITKSTISVMQVRRIGANKVEMIFCPTREEALASLGAITKERTK